MHISAANGYLEIVKLLLERGPDVHAVDSEGQTPSIAGIWASLYAAVNFGTFEEPLYYCPCQWLPQSAFSRRDIEQNEGMTGVCIMR
jgi:ankyrin repeat protein